MRKQLVKLSILVFLISAATRLEAFTVRAQSSEPDIFVQQPRQGEALQGVETISGKIRGELFQRMELSFTYADLEDPTWFFLGEFTREDIEGNSGAFAFEWDTTRITDGEYQLRIRAVFQDGELTERVANLRIRNYSPVETRTPGAVFSPEPGAVTDTAVSTPTVQLTPSPLPPNPVSLTDGEILRSLQQGAAAAGSLFGMGGIYLLIRKLRRNP